jgi:hypothetical protein
MEQSESHQSVGTNEFRSSERWRRRRPSHLSFQAECSEKLSILVHLGERWGERRFDTVRTLIVFICATGVVYRHLFCSANLWVRCSEQLLPVED